VERIGGAVAHAGRGRDAACGKDEHGDVGSCGVCGGEGARIERGVFAVGRGLGGRTCIGRRGAHRTVEIDERQNGRLPLQP
jgi:hypothetical protein